MHGEIYINPMQSRKNSTAKQLRRVALLFVLAICGCGGGKQEVTGDASGKVSLEGQPVTSGSISFISKDGKAGSSVIDSNGDYSIKKVVVGKYKVIVLPPPLPDPGSPGAAKKAGMAEFPGHPKKYRTDLTSDLEAEVKEGENKFDFDMKPQPSKAAKKK